MAKNTQEAEVIVTLNGQAAKKAITEMAAEYDRLRNAALEAYKAGDDALGKKLDAQAQKLTKDIEITRRETKKFADVMKNINGATLKELRSAANQLQGEINKLTPGTQEFITKSKQLQEVNTRIRQLTGSFKGLVEEEKQATFSLKGLADGFNKYFGMVTAGLAAVTGVSMAFRKAPEDAAKLDDTYADVMKTTGLMHDEVEALDKELMKIDTRTSREQLLLLARDAGKLGIQGKENILGFVRAADQIQVALGEDLGEGAIKQLGKIADVMGLTQSMGVEKSLLSIGSAVNAVGQASTASEAYLVEFTQRLAGVAAQTGISTANIIGFASGLDQSAMKVEMASTAFQKFLMKLYEDPAKFAEYANLEVGKFTDLLKNDANQAVVTILQALNEKDGFAALVPVFKDMGLDGARAVSVLASMATNINAVTDAQALANQEFTKATSVTDEYTVKNNNLQAQLEKARNEFHNASVALGQSLNPIMLKSTKATTYLIKALATYGKEIRNAAIAVAALTALIKLQTIAQGALNVVQKAGNVLRATGNTIIWAARTAFFKLIGATAAATIAQQQLNAVMSASVFGVIALAIGGLTMAITHWVKKSREAVEVNEKMLEIDKQADEEYAEQAGRVRALTAIVENNNIALGQRKKALEDLKKIVPDYHGDLTEEGKLINSNKAAIDEYCKSLREQLRLKAREEQLMEIERQIADLETKKANADEKAQKALEKAGGDNTRAKQGFWGWRKTEYGEAMSESESAQRQIDALEAQAEKLGGRIAEQSKKIEETSRTVLEEEGAKTNTILTQAQFDYLQERQEKLTKKEKEMVTKGYAALSDEESKSLKARYDKLMNADNKANDQRYQAELKALQQNERARQNEINQAFFLREITAQAHEEELLNIKVNSLNAQLDLARKYNQDTTTIEQQLLTAELERHKFYYNQQLQLSEQHRLQEETSLREQLANNAITQEEFDRRMLENREKYLKEQQDLAEGYGQDGSGLQLNDIEARQKEEERALKRHLENQEVTQDEYDSRMIEIRVKYLQQRLQLAQQNGQDETAILQAIIDAQMQAEDLALKKLAKMKEDAKKVIAGLDPEAARQAELQEELKRLDELHEAKLLSEEQYEQAVKQMRKQYADEDLNDKLGNIADYIEKANKLFEGASNFVTALKEAESAQLEAEYQKQLTAAGDNAEQREAIEAEYEQKQLDLKKKYADTEMAVNIAKTIANGAVAAIKAYADAGPVAGAILAALIAATTAAEVATIVAQRNAIKNTSVNSTGSTGSAAIGERTVTGYYEGGNTKKAASDHTPAGIVHANEWVAPAWLVRREPVVFANLERYRKVGSRGRSGSMSQGFAEGGFTGTAGTQGLSSAMSTAALEAAVYKGIRAALEGEWLRAYLIRKDLTELDAQDKRFKSVLSRG